MAVDDPQHAHDETPPPRKRRRWQFGLSTLLLVVTASAVVSWWYAQESWDEFQQRFTEQVKKLGGEIEWGSGETPTRLAFRYWGFSDSEPLTDERLKRLRRDLKRLGPFTLSLCGSPNARGQITDKGLGHLDGSPQLEVLCLRYTDVSDAGLEHLAGLEGLRFVDLRDTPVTDAGIGDLATRRPDLIAWRGPSGDQASPFAAGLPEFRTTPTAKSVACVLTETGTENRRLVVLPMSDGLHYSDPELRFHFLSAKEAIATLHGPISDSGVEVARLDLSTERATMLWQVFAQPLGVNHSKYRHTALAFVHGDRCVLVSDGSATFVEIRDLATGALLQRWVY